MKFGFVGVNRLFQGILGDSLTFMLMLISPKDIPKAFATLLKRLIRACAWGAKPA